MGSRSQLVIDERPLETRRYLCLLTFRSLLAPLLIFWCACLLASCRRTSPAASERVSYGRQIAPILALHCNGCHGSSTPSSGFRTASYAGLRAGGVLGDDIVPGVPDRSMVVKFIEGFRGPDQRMPLGAAPLRAAEIALVRRWITQGASNDHAATPCYRLQLPPVSAEPGGVLLISAQASAVADLVLSIRDRRRRILYSEEASVKQPPEQMDAAAPGRPVIWKINCQQDWPSPLFIQLAVRYASGSTQASLSTQEAASVTVATRDSVRSQCSPD